MDVFFSCFHELVQNDILLSFATPLSIKHHKKEKAVTIQRWNDRLLATVNICNPLDNFQRT